MSEKITWADWIKFSVEVLEGVIDGMAEGNGQKKRNYEDPREIGKEMGRVAQKELSKTGKRKRKPRK